MRYVLFCRGIDHHKCTFTVTLQRSDVINTKPGQSHETPPPLPRQPAIYGLFHGSSGHMLQPVAGQPSKSQVPCRYRVLRQVSINYIIWLIQLTNQHLIVKYHPRRQPRSSASVFIEMQQGVESDLTYRLVARLHSAVVPAQNCHSGTCDRHHLLHNKSHPRRHRRIQDRCRYRHAPRKIDFAVCHQRDSRSDLQWCKLLHKQAGISKGSLNRFPSPRIDMPVARPA